MRQRKATNMGTVSILAHDLKKELLFTSKYLSLRMVIFLLIFFLLIELLLDILFCSFLLRELVENCSISEHLRNTVHKDIVI